MISLVDLIGSEAASLQPTESSFLSRGLRVACWRYDVLEKSAISNQSKPVIIALHGGPGFPHNYILPLKLIACGTENGHSVIFYDQAGCGKSERVEDLEVNAPWLLTLDYYIEEVATLVEHYALTEYYLFGSSWGSIVVQEVAVRQPSGLRAIILDGALCDAQVYISTQWRDRIGTLPTVMQRILRQLEDEKQYSSPMYEAFNDILGKHFTCRTVPRPDCYHDAVAGFNQKIYAKMQGESEFTIGGVLKDWSITSRLSMVQVPALVLVGEFDTMTDECSMLVVDNIPYARPLVKIPHAGHCKIIDEPQMCVDAISTFLNEVHASSNK